MDIWFHRYTLTPRWRLSAVARAGARDGALLRVGNGFADVHPWPELGDAPLDEQLARLARGELTALTRASLQCAATDGAARERGMSLFEGLTIPLSHWPGADPPDGFDTVKLKDVTRIPDGVRVRLDFNGTLTGDEFLALDLPVERIDFVEDPCPYEVDVWRELRAEKDVRLAFDIGEPPAERAFDVLIHKPARIAEWPLFDGEVVVTSYMDHPLGQMHAAYVAATHDVSPRCGLFTHVLYEADAFLDAVRADGARLRPPEGTGLGFDELLARVPWKKLA
ncbi:MAG TPA: hypothetical protein VFN10_00600 [Thermoanaerobaculia bacterium]|nr:hypothetical protein [Thermoanaerobaculia bacterium]